MIFKTVNSTYEVNLDDCLVRRIKGVSDPTPRQGEDGVWKSYESITVPMVGATVMITWHTETEHKPGLIHGQPAEDVFGVPRGTETSPVEEIIK